MPLNSRFELPIKGLYSQEPGSTSKPSLAPGAFDNSNREADYNCTIGSH